MCSKAHVCVQMSKEYQKKLNLKGSSCTFSAKTSGRNDASEYMIWNSINTSFFDKLFSSGK